MFERRSALLRRKCPFVTAVLLAFYALYLPFHLLTEEHIYHVAASAVAHHDGESEHDEHDEHVPHAAADHSIEFANRSYDFQVSIDWFVCEISHLIYQPEPRLLLVFQEPYKVPKDSPPDPLQPRAPPFI